jgi:hypothetical protein
MGTQITAPTLGGTTIPYPGAGTRIEPIWISAEHTTIGGKTRKEVMARKYKYTLVYPVMGVTDYNALETVINGLVPVTFIYNKWPQSATAGVSVFAELSARELVYGTGDTSYWSSVTLTLTEVNSRI